MGRRKRRKTKDAPKWRRYLPGVLGGIAAIALVTFAIITSVGTDALIPISTATRLDDRTLLVAGVSGSDTDVQRWSAIATLGPDCVLRNRTSEEGVLRVLGVDGRRVWLDHTTRKVHTRKLPDLGLESEFTSAITGHPALSHGYQINGVAGHGLVLAAVNGKRFVLEPGRPIASADDLSFRPLGEMGQSAEPHENAMGYSETRKVLQTLELGSPIAVGDATGPVTFEDPPGFLVRSFELVVGGTSQALHRVGKDGKLAWSTSAAELLDIAVKDHQVVTLAWAGWLGGELTALVQLAEVHASSDDVFSEHTQWLLILDPHRGTVTAKREVSLPEE